MIKTKSDMKYYIKCDEIARFGKTATISEKMKLGSMWSYNVVLRKLEYSINCRKGVSRIVFCIFYKLRKKYLEQITGWYIPENVFGPGLCIVHKGPVIVSYNAKFGSNIRINAMVNIGASKGMKEAPQVGDLVYIGPGAKIFGDIKLGNNIAIGANAVVNKTIEKDNITLAGVPAKIISNRGCREYVVDVRDFFEERNRVI